ncbi:c-type cytochrome [Marimonas arenosa]|uniref:Cytochrome c n=1 Tax=Marimonas arenosa TaxID=1795305 RepID=A0AAE3WFU3_9RHOB|nr:cytochrome c [Marimonas arenosa]MDQ2090895.1 cytochrome c [Marimonas arenosa]
MRDGDMKNGHRTGWLAVGLVWALAGASLAHSGVQNAAVKARMALMGEIKEATGVIGGMVKGEIAFDPAKAAVARAALVRHASEITPAFEAQETDPKSEARPEVWSDWAGFAARAEAMATAAEALDTGSPEALADGLGALGQSCGGCHKLYRIEK